LQKQAGRAGGAKAAKQLGGARDTVFNLGVDIGANAVGAKAGESAA
jgi:hypothetical protein